MTEEMEDVYYCMECGAETYGNIHCAQCEVAMVDADEIYEEFV